MSNAGLSPKRYWQEPKYKEVGGKVKTLPDATPSPPERLLQPSALQQFQVPVHHGNKGPSGDFFGTWGQAGLGVQRVRGKVAA